MDQKYSRPRKRSQIGLGEEDLSLATRAAWLSYIGGQTQEQIAERLSISQTKAHRLIAQALERGLIKVFVQGEPAECLALEDDLTRRFGLARCIVAPSLPDGHNGHGSGPFAAVGAAAARLLHRELTTGGLSVIGVGKGRTLAAMVDHLPELDRPDLKIVSVSGSLTRNLSANPFDVVLRLAERSGGAGYFLPVPYLAGSIAERKLLIGQKSVRDLLDLARQAELVLVGIGSMAGDAHLRQVGMVTEPEWSALGDAGAVGDLMGSFIDSAGNPVALAINRLAVGLGFKELAGRRVVALAGGAWKAQAILAALRTGVIRELVTDEAAASRIVELAAREAGHA
jgi:DNA-binding transcriptional regulator LsrR (DeoR family)